MKGDERVRVVEVGKPVWATNPVHVRVELVEGGWTTETAYGDPNASAEAMSNRQPVEAGDLFWVWETSLR